MKKLLSTLLLAVLLVAVAVPTMAASFGGGAAPDAQTALSLNNATKGTTNAAASVGCTHWAGYGLLQFRVYNVN